MTSGGHSSSWCMGLSLSRPLLLQSTGSRRAGSAIVAHRPICSAACGMWDLPRPGLELAPPALAGRLSTTAPPGKPLLCFSDSSRSLLPCLGDCTFEDTVTSSRFFALSLVRKDLYLQWRHGGECWDPRSRGTG